MSRIESVCVYCGSGPGTDPAYMAAAETLGRDLAARGVRLVYGGGSTGLMGAVASATLAAGGKVTGIIHNFLSIVSAPTCSSPISSSPRICISANGRCSRNLTPSWLCPAASERSKSSSKMLTWAQLGRHDKPVVIVDINGFWRHLQSLLDHMKDEGFLHSLEQFKPVFVERADAILPALLPK